VCLRIGFFLQVLATLGITTAPSAIFKKRVGTGVNYVCLCSCIFLQILATLGLTMALSAILVKTSTIYSIFISTFQVSAVRMSQDV
jgi:hypothetical protein